MATVIEQRLRMAVDIGNGDGAWLVSHHGLFLRIFHRLIPNDPQLRFIFLPPAFNESTNEMVSKEGCETHAQDYQDHFHAVTLGFQDFPRCGH